MPPEMTQDTYYALLHQALDGLLSPAMLRLIDRYEAPK